MDAVWQSSSPSFAELVRTGEIGKPAGSLDFVGLTACLRVHLTISAHWAMFSAARPFSFYMTP
jgi:hypothetical protein